MSVVALIICGAPLAERVGDMVRALEDAGWGTEVVGTPMAANWATPSSHPDLPIRLEYRTPSQRQPRSELDAVIICPATFNTANKIAAGTADNYATSLACESIGQGLPVVVAPMVNNKLWGHPAWKSTLATLVQAGVKLLDVQTGEPGTSPVQSGAGEIVVEGFDPAWLPKSLEEFS
ncbi:flavoprotein [Actinoplanes xinjiangensis]|uniref:flavoprotein n=1 Tax=Actinoplanes xinjiangensis TaxID=512350 RepID=UPI003432F551